jgi:hypothetical protein
MLFCCQHFLLPCGKDDCVIFWFTTSNSLFKRCTSLTGLLCDCTTEACLEQGTRMCSGTWCYSETYDGFVETGCSDLRQPLLCENRLSSKLPQHIISHCCNDRDFCNKNVVPTPAPPRSKNGINLIYNKKFGAVLKQIRFDIWNYIRMQLWSSSLLRPCYSKFQIICWR